MDLDADPWYWSVDDVVYFFQNKAAGYVTDIPHGRLPPLDSFLPALRDNDIAGAILLTEVDAEMLRKDCSISSAGVRSMVMRCIKKLQQESPKYLSHQSLQPSAPTSAQPVSGIDTPQNHLPAFIESSNESNRLGEPQSRDVHHKKRRRLNSSNLIRVQEQDAELGNMFAQAKSIVSGDEGYLGSSVSLVDDLFYGKTKFGQEVEYLYPKGDVVEHQDPATALSNRNFHFAFQNKPVGEARYVYKQMRHFLVNDERMELSRNGRTAIALAPCRDGLQSPRSATVVQFTCGKDEPVAMKENLDHLTNGYIPEEYMQQDVGEWDFLVEKHRSADDRLLPVYGESDDESRDESTQNTESDPQDAAEEEVDSHVLQRDRVADIIEECVKGHIAKWKDSLGMLEKKKAWKVWKKMKGSRTMRASLIHAAHGRIEHLTKRLNKFEKEIMCTEHRTEKSVRDACVVLEVTIEDREEQLWMIEVWQRKQEPSHMVHHGTYNTSLPTGLAAGEVTRPLHVHPDDRLSVSPAPNGGTDADVEMKDDTGSGGGVETNEQARHDADVETEDETPYATPAENSPYITPAEYSQAPGLPANDSDSEHAEAAFLPFTREAKSNPEMSLQSTNRMHGVEANTSVDIMADNLFSGDDDENGDFSPDVEPAEPEELESLSTLVKPAKSSLRSKPPPVRGIDLTTTSPGSRTTKSKMTPATPATKYSGVPAGPTAAIVDSWDMSTLASRNDRERIMIKLLRDAGEQNRQRLYNCYSSNRAGFNTPLLAACHLAKQSGMAGVGPVEDDIEGMSLAGSICVSWLFPSLSADDIRNMSDGEFSTTANAKQLDLFTSMLSGFLSKRNGPLFNTLTQAPSKKNESQHSDSLVEISDDSDDSDSSDPPTTRRQRKREVKFSEAGLNSRTKAHQREQRFAESQTGNSTQLAAMIAGDPNSSDIEINPVRNDNADPIYVHNDIGRKMKTHQIEGARFLWREITADDDDGPQGCVLAHTMGLGKTMQTIALLVAVSQAARSEKTSVYRQIPHHLRPDGIRDRMLRILILCPPALIENWDREIRQWAPNMLGNIFSLDSGSKATHFRHLEDWMRVGGVVLLGYQKYRTMVLQKSHPTQKTPIPEQQQARAKDILLRGTEIVVADEAHSLKNNKSDLGKAAAQIETHSRIALTGTPMSNDVNEIYAVISWAAPGYLGDPTEFRARFSEPINDGLYPDSSGTERKKSIIKLKVLHSEIQPKVNRANIEVLRGSLRPKVEYVITVALGKVQTELYKRYVKALLSKGGSSEADQVTIFSWLTVLTLLTNHPQCFRLKLLAPAPKKKSKESVQRDEDDEDDEYMGPTTESRTDADGINEALADAPLHKLGLNENMTRQILDGIGDSFDPQLSAKMMIFLTLLDYCNECGDKVLVFSSSIPTLEYLDKLLTRQELLFGRIDGSTTMQKRMKVLEDFHNHDFDIMLVSTRAGGVGLNIQGANRVFIMDFGFNPTWEEQAIGRAYRIGQKKPVYVYRFVAGGTFESEMYNKQLFKMSLAQRVVDKKKPQRHAKRDSREYLYVPKTVEQENLDEESGKDPKVLDRLLSRHGRVEKGRRFDTMIRAIKTMETLQEEVMDEQLDEEAQRQVDLEIKQARERVKGKSGASAATQLPTPSRAVKLALRK